MYIVSDVYYVEVCMPSEKACNIIHILSVCLVIYVSILVNLYTGAGYVVQLIICLKSRATERKTFSYSVTIFLRFCKLYSSQLLSSERASGRKGSAKLKITDSHPPA